MSGLLGGGKKPKSESQPEAIGSMRVQQSSYGVAIPLCYGTNRLSGNMLWYDDFKSYAHQQNVGGKGGMTGGGGGKGGGGTTTYTYSASFIFGLAEGVCSPVGTVWQTKTKTSLGAIGGVFYSGAAAQAAWGYLTSNFPSKALGYSNTCYVAFANYDLGQAAETPNISFQLHGIYDDSALNYNARANYFINDFLTRALFPAANVYSFASSGYENYVNASGLFFSPFCTEQKAATEYLTEWAQASNSEWIWSGDKLKLIPYGDAKISGNGYTYTPNLTPVYAITDDDFIRSSDDEEPVQVIISDAADAYNQIPIEYLDASNDYNIATYTAEDAGHVNMYGPRPASAIQAHYITSAAIAQTVANNILWRGLYVRTQYKFTLGWRFVLLEPMDLITITDSQLGLVNEPCRIVEIEESEDGYLTITAEEFPNDIHGAALYPSQISERYAPDYNQAPTPVNEPVIFESPLLLVQQAAVELLILVSGQSSLWGGCNVWVSNDDVTYSLLDKIVGGARHGTLRSQLLAGAATIDTSHTLQVDMSISRGTINNSPTPQDATSLNTLSYVDGELLAFGNSSLVGANQYDFSYLVRGAYGTTNAAHAAGKKFARIDDKAIRYPVDQTRVGQTIYFKFQSFNIYSGGLEDITGVTSYPYTITGSALNTPLPNVTGVTTNYVSNILQIRWSPITDIRSPSVDYEVRKGATWATSQTLGRTKEVFRAANGDGTYWIAAHYQTPTGKHVYSASPQAIVITGSALTKNVIQNWSEDGTHFSGTCSGGAVYVSSSNTIELMGTNDILSLSNFLTEPDILWGGTAESEGYYEIPSAHIVNLAYMAACQVGVSWSVRGININSNFLGIPNVLAATDILGAAYDALVAGTPEIALSLDGSTWGSWQPFTAGVYNFKSIKMRIKIESFDPQVMAQLQNLSFFVDVPDRTDHAESVSILAAGSSISYLDSLGAAKPFNAVPNVQITILNAQAGDDVVITSPTTGGFTVQIMNGGVGVARTINWFAQGY